MTSLRRVFHPNKKVIIIDERAAFSSSALHNLFYFFQIIIKKDVIGPSLTKRGSGAVKKLRLFSFRRFCQICHIKEPIRNVGLCVDVTGQTRSHQSMSKSGNDS